MRHWPDETFCNRLINMDQHSNENAKNPVNKLDAVNKAYADRIKYKKLLVIFLILLRKTTHSSPFPLRKLLPLER